MGSDESVTKTHAIVQSPRIIGTAFCAFRCLVRYSKFVNCSKAEIFWICAALQANPLGLARLCPATLSSHLCSLLHHFYRVPSCAIVTSQRVPEAVDTDIAAATADGFSIPTLTRLLWTVCRYDSPEIDPSTSTGLPVLRINTSGATALASCLARPESRDCAERRSQKV